MPQGYKDTEFNKDTGRRREIRDADYTIRGDIDVRGDLTQDGEAVGGTALAKATGAEVDTGTDDAKYVTALALEDSDYIKEADLPPGGGSVTLETPAGAVNGVNAVFVFTGPPIFVTYQKQIQDLTDDYTLVGSTVTFVQPPVSGTVKGLVSA